MSVKLSEGVPIWEPAERWTAADAEDLYEVPAWGKGYFAVGSNGHLWVRPSKDPQRGIDLKELVDSLVLRGH